MYFSLVLRAAVFAQSSAACRQCSVCPERCLASQQPPRSPAWLVRAGRGTSGREAAAYIHGRNYFGNREAGLTVFTHAVRSALKDAFLDRPARRSSSLCTRIESMAARQKRNAADAGLAAPPEGTSGLRAASRKRTLSNGPCRGNCI